MRAKCSPGSFIIVALGLLLSAAWALWLRHPDFPLDDAYIVQHSVDGLFAGREDRFPDSTPLQGVTSPAHVVLISLFGIFVPTAWSQLVVVALAAIAYTLGVFRFAKVSGASEPWPELVTALSIIAGLSLYHLLNGLETGLAMAAIIWTMLWFRDPVPGRPINNVGLGVLPFIRPELGALSLLLFVREIWAVRKFDRAPSQVLRSSAWALIGAAPFALFLLLNGESLIPNSMSAKVYFFAEGCLPYTDKIRITINGVEQFALSLGPAGLGFFALLLSPLRFTGAAFLLVFMAAYTERIPGAIFHNWFRYPYILMPFAIVGWIALVTVDRRYVRQAGKALLLLAIAFGVFQSRDTWEKYEEGISISRIELAGVARWITSNLKEKDAILVHDSGYISLTGKQPLFDLVGLKTSSSILIHRQYTWGTCSRNPSAIDKIARESGARFLVVFTDWDQIFRLTDSLRRMGWTVTRADRSRGRTRYEVYQITPPRP